MGTRGIVVILDKSKKKVIEMYKQYDSYPAGLGQELKNFINSGTMVNGFSQSESKQFNGISCFAAQLVANFKDGVGGTYLHAPSSFSQNKKKYNEKYGVDYVYEIDNTLKLRCWDAWSGKEIFNLKEPEDD